MSGNWNLAFKRKFEDHTQHYRYWFVFEKLSYGDTYCEMGDRKGNEIVPYKGKE